MMINENTSEVFSALNVRTGVPARDYTSFRVGGPMAYFAEPSSWKEAAELLEAAKESRLPVYVIGNGSNLLVSDKGVNALFIRIGSNMSSFGFDGSILTAEAGALLSVVSKASVAAGLMGLEWASGIPGTVGGGAAMNAGAYGGELSQVLREVSFIRDGELITRKVADGDLGYRYSAFAYPNAVIVRAVMELKEDDGGAKARMDDYTARRRDKQPLEFPSAGSTFKRPVGNFAGALIEQAGLKGKRIGGAMVSPKHAGFIVNCGGASFNDVAALICFVRADVYVKFGVLLEPEVKIIE